MERAERLGIGGSSFSVPLCKVDCVNFSVVFDHNEDFYTMNYSNGEEAAYLAGLQKGRLDTLERGQQELKTDVARLKTAHYMLYGAFALVTFLPSLKGFLAP